MNRLRWVSIKLIEALGWHGTAGLLLLLACGLYYVSAVYPLEREMQALRAAAVSTGTAGRERGATAPDPQAELRAFGKFFEGAALEQHLTAIHEAGKAMGFTLKRIEYRMLEEKRAQLQQYQIVMPVNHSYPRVRQFLSLVLAKVPTMSLDHVSFQRKKIGDGMVDVELRFTLFLAQPI